ncbi:MAG: iron-containing alcohol dehydrogenase [Halobacteriales archaeon]|nr:iron-containing alcohol dehydrogenase [Halobacteriales archaeon]
MPVIRVGAGAADELGYQLDQLGLDGDERGLIVTDETIVDLGHAGRVADELAADGFDVDVYDGADREPSIEAVEECIAFVREEMGEDGYDFYLGLGGGSCMDIAKAMRAVVANGGEVLDYVAAPTGAGEALTESGPPLDLLLTTAGTGRNRIARRDPRSARKNIKEGISSPHVRADAAVLDPTTTTLPPDLTAKTAMDALGHAIEGVHHPLLRRLAPTRKPD